MTEHTHVLWTYYYYTMYIVRNFFCLPTLCKNSLKQNGCCRVNLLFPTTILVSSHNIWSSLPTKYQLCANLAPPPSYQGSEEYTKGQFRIFGVLVFPYPPFPFLRVAVKEMTQGCICLSLYLAQKSVRGEGDVGFNR